MGNRPLFLKRICFSINGFIIDICFRWLIEFKNVYAIWFIWLYSKSGADLFGTEKLIKIFCNFMWWYVLVAIHDILYLLTVNRRWFYTIKFILDSESKDFLILTIILYESGNSSSTVMLLNVFCYDESDVVFNSEKVSI